MADVKVQRASFAIGDGSTSVTLTAGVDYTASSAASAAFARLVNTIQVGTVTMAPSRPPRASTRPTSPTRKISSRPLTIARRGSVGAMIGEVEFIEYVGAAGGGNEFVVRGHRVIDEPPGRSSISSRTDPRGGRGGSKDR